MSYQTKRVLIELQQLRQDCNKGKPQDDSCAVGMKMNGPNQNRKSESSKKTDKLSNIWTQNLDELDEMGWHPIKVITVIWLQYDMSCPLLTSLPPDCI